MAKRTAPRPSRRPRAPRTRNDTAAVRALDTIGEALDAEGKGLARDEVTRAVAERKAVTAYLRGLERAYAHRSNATLGIDIASSHDSNQVNRSRARAAIGVRFQPTETGFLGVRPAVHVDDAWSLKWNHGKAHAFGWTGILVQAFDPAGNLLDTPIDKKRREFDESGGGSIIPPVEIDVALPDGPNFWGDVALHREGAVVCDLDLVRRRHPRGGMANRPRHERRIRCVGGARRAGAVHRVVLHAAGPASVTPVIAPR